MTTTHFQKKPGRAPMRVYNLDELFAWIVEYKRAHDGNSPSIREMADQFQIPSTGTTSVLLKRLADVGKIVLKRNGSSRMIQVVGGKWTMEQVK